MNVSGFSFVHDSLVGGLPIIEAIQAVRDYVDDIVVVDMESTDRTPEILRKLGVTVITSPWAWPWSDDPKTTLRHAFGFHTECKHETVLFFEADEVYDDLLLQNIRREIERGKQDLGVWRLQVEQNFQRCRWYPTPVHRVFPRGGGSYVHHPTNCPDWVQVLPPEAGFMWDCSNNFKDDWFNRKKIQSELWGPPRSLMVPEHFTQSVEITVEEEKQRLTEPHWSWTATPLAIPAVLRPLLGVTDYRESRAVKILLGEL